MAAGDVAATDHRRGKDKRRSVGDGVDGSTTRHRPSEQVTSKAARHRRGRHPREANVCVGSPRVTSHSAKNKSLVRSSRRMTSAATAGGGATPSLIVSHAVDDSDDAVVEGVEGDCCDSSFHGIVASRAGVGNVDVAGPSEVNCAFDVAGPVVDSGIQGGPIGTCSSDAASVGRGVADADPSNVGASDTAHVFDSETSNADRDSRVHVNTGAEAVQGTKLNEAGILVDQSSVDSSIRSSVCAVGFADDVSRDSSDNAKAGGSVFFASGGTNSSVDGIAIADVSQVFVDAVCGNVAGVVAVDDAINPTTSAAAASVGVSLPSAACNVVDNMVDFSSVQGSVDEAATPRADAKCESSCVDQSSVGPRTQKTNFRASFAKAEDIWNSRGADTEGFDARDDRDFVVANSFVQRWSPNGLVACGVASWGSGTRHSRTFAPSAVTISPRVVRLSQVIQKQRRRERKREKSVSMQVDRLCSQWVNTGRADRCFAVTVGLYGLVLSIDIELSLQGARLSGPLGGGVALIFALQTVLAVVYAAELVLRVSANGWICFCSFFGALDVFSILFAICDLFLYIGDLRNTKRFVGVLMFLRLLRVLRVARWLDRCPKLSMLFCALASHIFDCFWFWALIVILAYAGAMVCASTLGSESGTDEEIHDLFGSMGKSMLTHLMFVFQEGWPDIAEPMMRKSWMWSFYVCVYILVTGNILLNCVRGVICERIIVAAAIAERDTALMDDSKFPQFRLRFWAQVNRTDLHAAEVMTSIECGNLCRTFEMQELLADMQVRMPVTRLHHVSVFRQDESGGISPDKLFDGLMRLRGNRNTGTVAEVLHNDVRRTSLVVTQVQETVTKTKFSMHSVASNIYAELKAQAKGAAWFLSACVADLSAIETAQMHEGLAFRHDRRAQRPVALRIPDIAAEMTQSAMFRTTVCHTPTAVGISKGAVPESEVDVFRDVENEKTIALTSTAKCPSVAVHTKVIARCLEEEAIHKAEAALARKEDAEGVIGTCRGTSFASVVPCTWATLLAACAEVSVALETLRLHSYRETYTGSSLLQRGKARRVVALTQTEAMDVARSGHDIANDVAKQTCSMPRKCEATLPMTDLFGHCLGRLAGIDSNDTGTNAVSGKWPPCDGTRSSNFDGCSTAWSRTLPEIGGAVIRGGGARVAASPADGGGVGRMGSAQRAPPVAPLALATEAEVLTLQARHSILPSPPRRPSPALVCSDNVVVVNTEDISSSCVGVAVAEDSGAAASSRAGDEASIIDGVSVLFGDGCLPWFRRDDAPSGTASRKSGDREDHGSSGSATLEHASRHLPQQMKLDERNDTSEADTNSSANATRFACASAACQHVHPAFPSPPSSTLHLPSVPTRFTVGDVVADARKRRCLQTFVFPASTEKRETLVAAATSTSSSWAPSTSKAPGSRHWLRTSPLSGGSTVDALLFPSGVVVGASASSDVIDGGRATKIFAPEKDKTEVAVGASSLGRRNDGEHVSFLSRLRRRRLLTSDLDRLAPVWAGQRQGCEQARALVQSAAL
eukprot:TRINITY_DN40761_c0_g1_i2.p1 TRINITY_DN40761_c0_g1~~TRINITY_DN40761_c0_g1_i2.p1  ORF type:complete len:1547 (+),score=250.28 TRINITY_DN40761_c0_g1_i2:72-4643(+)